MSEQLCRAKPELRALCASLAAIRCECEEDGAWDSLRPVAYLIPGEFLGGRDGWVEVYARDDADGAVRELLGRRET